MIIYIPISIGIFFFFYKISTSQTNRPTINRCIHTCVPKHSWCQQEQQFFSTFFFCRNLLNIFYTKTEKKKKMLLCCCCWIKRFLSERDLLIYWLSKKKKNWYNDDSPFVFHVKSRSERLRQTCEQPLWIVRSKIILKVMSFMHWIYFWEKH